MPRSTQQPPLLRQDGDRGCVLLWPRRARQEMRPPKVRQWSAPCGYRLGVRPGPIAAVPLTIGTTNRNASMYNHAPEPYICPFCVLIQGITDKSMSIQSVQSDIICHNQSMTAFI